MYVKVEQVFKQTKFKYSVILVRVSDEGKKFEYYKGYCPFNDKSNISMFIFETGKLFAIISTMRTDVIPENRIPLKRTIDTSRYKSNAILRQDNRSHQPPPYHVSGGRDEHSPYAKTKHNFPFCNAWCKLKRHSICIVSVHQNK